MTNNILTILMRTLDVPHTEEYTLKALNTEPLGNTFFGLAALLARYGIDTRSVKFNDKMAVDASDLPLIVVFGKEFALLSSLDEDKVKLITGQGKKFTLSKEEFCTRRWDGNALLVSRRVDSSEPDYLANMKRQTGSVILSSFMAIAIIALFVAAILNNSGQWSLWSFAIFTINLVGCCVGGLLLRKDLHLPSRLTERLCGLIKESDCDNVTSSDAANFFNIAKLSEIGAGFFMVNLCWLIFNPGDLFWPGVVAIGVLPFTFWSLWYQKFRSGSWCVLCLFTLILMWAQAIIYVACGSIFEVSDDLMLPVILMSSYIIVVGLIHRAMSLFAARREAVTWEARYNALRVDDKVMEAFMKDSPVTSADSESCSSLVFGNPDARRSITVFSNPYCGPCAEMHTMIEKFPSDKLNVRYVMTYFTDERSVINRCIIAAYQKFGAEKTWEIMTRWFAGGKKEGEAFFSSYELNPDAPDVLAEFDKQKLWRDRHHFPGTPTILFNGKEIRQPYSVNDYMYFPL